MSKKNSSESFCISQMPADVEAERCLLGGILRDPEIMGTVVMSISNADFFYVERHQLIWEALYNLNKSVTQIDIVTLSSELSKMGKLNLAGGSEYICELEDAVASSANVPWLLEHLRKKAVLRQLVRTTNEIARQAMDPSSNPDEVLQDAERDIFAIADKQVRNTLKPIDNFVAPLLEREHHRRDSMTGVPTGITELDDLTNGLQNSDLIILAARPGVGKTSFAMTVAANAAIRFGKSVAFFSLELDGLQFAERMLCSQAQIDSNRLRTGKLHDDEKRKLFAAVTPINQAPLYVDDNADLGIMELMSKACQLKHKGQLDLLIIDNIQLMKVDTKESRAVAYEEIARGLKILAKELQIPVIAIALLSCKDHERHQYSRDQLQLSSLREVGSIERFADMVWFVEREFLQTHKDEDRYKAKLIVAKHRNGSVKDIDLTFMPEFTTFYDATDMQQNSDEDYYNYHLDKNDDIPATDFGGY